MNSGKKWIVVSLALFFIAGILCGVVVERHVLHGMGRRDHRGGEKFSRDRIIEKMTEDLSLTPEQAGKIGVIFEKYGPEMESMRKDIHEKMAGLRNEIDAEITGILDDEQKRKFEKITLEDRKKDEKRGERKPPGIK